MAPCVSAMAGSNTAEEVTGRFVVVEADESVVLRSVGSGQVFTLSNNPGVESTAVLDATLVPQQPLGLTHTVASIEAARTVPVRLSADPPSDPAQSAGASLAPGESAAPGHPDGGVLHVIGVAPDSAAARARALKEDDSLRVTAARHGLFTVEIRWSESSGFVTVRYFHSDE